MSQRTSTNRFTWFAAATALSTAGFLVIPVSAQADPMFPLAPACDNWELEGGPLIIQQFPEFLTIGVEVPWSGQKVDSTGRAKRSYGGSSTDGNAYGGLHPGNAISFNAFWAGNPGWTSFYRGQINPDGSASGTTEEPAAPLKTASDGSHTPSERVDEWRSVNKFTCVAVASAEVPKPAEIDTPTLANLPPAPPQAPPEAATTATVISDVDVYDHKNEPDGAGQIIGILLAGTEVQPAGPCEPESWCQVGGPAVPTGNGWVWGHLQF